MKLYLAAVAALSFASAASANPADPYKDYWKNPPIVNAVKVCMKGELMSKANAGEWITGQMVYDLVGECDYRFSYTEGCQKSGQTQDFCYGMISMYAAEAINNQIKVQTSPLKVSQP